MRWKRVAAATLPEYQAGDVYVAFGEEAPNESGAYVTDAWLLHKHVALYGDTRAMWWSEVTKKTEEPKGGRG